MKSIIEEYGYIYAMTDPKTNTFIYVELQYCNYFTDINYEKTIDEKYLPIGFDASQGNPTEIEIRKKYY